MAITITSKWTLDYSIKSCLLNQTNCQDAELINYLYSNSVYIRQKSLDDEPTVFFDPNKMSADGTVAITSFDFSNDEKMVAYAYTKSGSDWNKLKIRNVETGEDYPETLVGLKFSTTLWTSDNKGFFYNVSVSRKPFVKMLHSISCFSLFEALSWIWRRYWNR